MKRLLLLLLAFPLMAVAQADETDPRAIIRQAMDHWRGTTSYSDMTMLIHRPDWERSMSMRAWTQGDKHSLVRVTAPSRDAGNGTLMIDNKLWTYTPKINRVIKVPSSMMGQSWMGSDLSNDDISKSTDIIDQYEHSLVETRVDNGHTVHVIQSIPHEEAAVVWGREVLSIRDDGVLLEHQFWDQDGVLVKRMHATQVTEMGGRTVARVLRMENLEEPGRWTEMRLESAEFDLALPDNIFTLSNLRNPRQ